MPLQQQEGGRPGRIPGWTAALLGMALVPALSFLGAAAGVVLFAEGMPVYAAAQAVTAAAMGAVAAVLARRSGRPIPWRTDAAGLATGALAGALFYPAAMLASQAMASAMPAEPVSVPAMGPALAWPLMALLPAVSEELLCRGLVFGAFRRHGALAAVLVSAAGFACLHGSLQQGAYTLVLGLAWGCLREATGSVAPCVAAHLLFNTVGVMEMLGRPMPRASGPAGWAALSCAAVLAGAAGAVLLRKARSRSLRLNLVDESAPEPMGAVHVAAAAVLCGVNAAVNFALAAL